MNDPHAPFLDRLRADLAGPLPGRAAQYRMAPRPRPGDDAFEQPRADTRQGGVLLLFYPYGGRLALPLILRPTYTGVHSGQVSLPGGGRESGDADLTATALREAYEEVGAEPGQVQVLGRLSPLYVFASNYLVLPTVGWCTARPDFKLDPYEVELLIETPLADLLDERNRREEAWNLRGYTAQVPYFSVQGQTVWGATAMILSELLALPSVQQVRSEK
jgi:8-oxo-dGTP pyrophosphatase MutT (NUDIX family)